MELSYAEVDHDAQSAADIDARLLADIVDSIVRAVPTSAIYLFGSRARGDASASSDIDLYVVTSDSLKTSSSYAADARYALLDLLYREGYDFDLIAKPLSAFEQDRKKSFNVEYHVVREGIKLYG